MSRSTQRAARTLVIAMACAHLLAGCGGGGSSSAAPSAPPASPPPPPSASAPALLIGVERAITGTGSSAAGFARLNLYDPDGTNGALLASFNVAQAWDWNVTSTGNMNPATGVYSDDRFARVWTVDNGQVQVTDVTQRNQSPRRVTNTSMNSAVTDFCFIFAVGTIDVSAADGGFIVLRRAGPDLSCNTLDDQLLLVRASQRADEPATAAPPMAGVNSLVPLGGQAARQNLAAWAIFEQTGALRVWRPDLSAPAAQLASIPPPQISGALLATRSLGVRGPSYVALRASDGSSTRIWRVDPEAAVAGAAGASTELTIPGFVDSVQADMGGLLARAGGPWYRIDDSSNTAVRIDTAAMGTVLLVIPADEGVYVVGQAPSGAQTVYLVDRTTAQALPVFSVAAGSGDVISAVLPQRGRVLIRTLNNARQAGVALAVDTTGRVLQQIDDVTSMSSIPNPTINYAAASSADRLLLTVNPGGRNAGGSAVHVWTPAAGTTLILGTLPATVRDADITGTLGPRAGNRVLRARKTNSATGTVAEDAFYFNPAAANSLRRLSNNINF